ncbi:MAG TPA: glycosyl hydrolase [Candidatus Limnocylindria bacterium]|jgi:hypothetical protein|nr:glycosyl hydrolase [Candidatus Limnocylindria bacterium]
MHRRATALFVVLAALLGACGPHAAASEPTSEPAAVLAERPTATPSSTASVAAPAAPVLAASVPAAPAVSGTPAASTMVVSAPSTGVPAARPSVTPRSSASSSAPAPSPSPSPAPTAAARSPIALGAYVSGAPWDPARLDAFAALVGAAPRIVMWYQDWAHEGVREFDARKMDAVAARGAMPLLTWEPHNYTSGVDQPRYALRTIVRGDHDPYLRAFAAAAAAWGRPFYLRFAHEMNGDWNSWSPGVNGNTSAEYRLAWQHVHRIFDEAGATNVRWVWSPNVANPTTTPFRDVYPGDAFVDWIALDGYNGGTALPWGGWTSLVDVFAASYDALVALSPRPMLVAETASAEAGGDKAAWIRTGLVETIPSRFPRVRGVVWFEERKETDWRVASSAASLDAFRAAAASELYRGVLP